MKASFKNTYITFLLLICIISCQSSKKSFYKGAFNNDNAHLNVIEDITRTYKTSNRYFNDGKKPFNVFRFFREMDLKNGTYLLSISPENNTIPIRIEEKIGEVPKSYFPNRFIIRENKLFLWQDSITPLKNDILEVMDDFGILDSIEVKKSLNLLPENYIDDRLYKIDDKLESIYYFICKSDISRYKKVKTQWSKIKNDLPKIKCPE